MSAWLDGGENEKLCDATAMRQWEASLKRPDLAEKDRVRGALEAFKRQAVALAAEEDLAASVTEDMVNRALDAADFCRNPDTAKWMRAALEAGVAASKAA